MEKFELPTAEDLSKLSKKQLVEIVLQQHQYIGTVLALVTLHIGALAEDMSRAADAFESGLRLSMDIDGQSSRKN